MKKDFIYLASASPRRGELLRQIGVQFEARAAAIAEVQADGEAPDAYVRRPSGGPCSGPTPRSCLGCAC